MIGVAALAHALQYGQRHRGARGAFQQGEPSGLADRQAGAYAISGATRPARQTPDAMNTKLQKILDTTSGNSPGLRFAALDGNMFFT